MENRKPISHRVIKKNVELSGHKYVVSKFLILFWKRFRYGSRELSSKLSSLSSSKLYFKHFILRTFLWLPLINYNAKTLYFQLLEFFFFLEKILFWKAQRANLTIATSGLPSFLFVLPILCVLSRSFSSITISSFSRIVLKAIPSTFSFSFSWTLCNSR